MKKLNIFLSALLILGMMSACDDYLDKLPDDRAEVDTEKDVTDLLKSAYPLNSTIFVMEMSSDNVDDNGKSYAAQPNQEQCYRWQDVETEGNDDPYQIWNDHYRAVATANEALQDMELLGNPATLRGERAEALLCRAFAMYQLYTVFCMAYDPTRADKYLGLPYPKKSDSDVNAVQERGTLKHLFENIDKDIEEALALLDDNHLTVPKYHFNTKAAYAFAARFNLMYHQYDKAIEYADRVLTDNPVKMLRNRLQYISLGADDLNNRYVQSDENANLLLLPAYSNYGRINQGWSPTLRFAHNFRILGFETFWAYAPWSKASGTSKNNACYAAHKQYGINQVVRYPKIQEFWEVKDKINDTGFAHIVDAVFTGDETLLVRAEAYALKNDAAHALKDINLWLETNCEEKYGTATRPVMTEKSLNTFMDSLKYTQVTPESNLNRTIKKQLHPQGFTVAKGTQENLIQLILHMRRLETLFQGQRFLDLKRYGIEYSHLLDGEDAIVFKTGDLRGAIQIPQTVIKAGIEKNPR